MERHILYIQGDLKKQQFEIDEVEFNELEKAKEFLHFVVTHEESYDILVSNFMEFEQEILQLTLQNMLYSEYSTESFYELRMRLNKRLINLLTSVKLYQDLGVHQIPKSIYERAKKQNEIKRFFSKEYDNNIHYKFMEELRRYTQHAGLPIHLTSFNTRNIGEEDKFRHEYSINFSSYSERLKKDKMFNHSKFPELEDEIDLKSAVRHYIESISLVHISIRELFKELMIDSRETIKSAHAKFHEKYKCNTDYLRVVCVEEELTKKDIAILLDWDDVRIKLQQKNRKLIKLSKGYITNISKEE